MDPKENGRLPVTRSAHLPGNGESIPVFGAGGEVVAWMEPLGGITKREHFAAMAMQGMLSDECGGQGQSWNADACAERACQFSDALLRALAAGGEA